MNLDSLKIILISTIVMLSNFGCVSVDRGLVNSYSINDIFGNPYYYKDKRVCIKGYLNFDRSTGLISDDKVVSKFIENSVIPLRFDKSIFFDRQSGEYKVNTPVVACGRVAFDKECFDKSGGKNCVPGRILLMKASVKIKLDE